MPTVNRSFPFTQVIVIGGTGQTGHRVLELLLEYENVKLVATSRAVSDGLPAGPLASTVVSDARKWAGRIKWCPLDLEGETTLLITQLEALKSFLNNKTPTALVFAAAFTNVDGCENDPAYCARVNETNTIEVMRWARTRYEARLAFYSTDYVFDGEKGQYSEEEPRKAICVYGQSKVTAEEWLENNAPDALILRTTGVYDYVRGSKNFLMQMLELWGQGKQTRIPADQEANPVWALELARATVELLARGSRGIYHVAGGTQLKRTEFALTIAKVFGFDSALITPVQTKELGQKARRPLKGGLNCAKLKKELGWAPGGALEILESLKWLHRS
jgi:dTDP-4-dehydrorhamnose reductase